MKYLFLLFTFSIINNLSAQKVFSVSNSSQADVKVYVTSSSSDADLKVYKKKVQLE